MRMLITLALLLSCASARAQMPPSPGPVYIPNGWSFCAAASGCSQNSCTGGCSFVVPNTVSLITLYGVAPGGGGGGGWTATGAAGGGGGGEGMHCVAYPLTVTPGSTLTVTVPSAPGGGAAGSDGTTANDVTITGALVPASLTIKGGVKGLTATATVGGNGGNGGGGSGGSGGGGAGSTTTGATGNATINNFATPCAGGGGGGAGAGSSTGGGGGVTGAFGRGTAGSGNNAGGGGSGGSWGVGGIGGANNAVGAAPILGYGGGGGGGGSGQAGGSGGPALLIFVF